MSSPKYQAILGSFVAIAILLALILWAIIAFDSDRPKPVSGWKIATAGDYSFQYPESLSTIYINIFDWPPQLMIADEEFSCQEAGAVDVRAGRTELKNIDGRNFCVTEIVEAAAGSIYTQYAYAFKYDDGTAILNFSIRSSQCGNYPELEMDACERERETFNLDSLVAQIAETVVKN